MNHTAVIIALCCCIILATLPAAAVLTPMHPDCHKTPNAARC